MSIYISIPHPSHHFDERYETKCLWNCQHHCDFARYISGYGQLIYCFCSASCEDCQKCQQCVQDAQTHQQPHQPRNFLNSSALNPYAGPLRWRFSKPIQRDLIEKAQIWQKERTHQYLITQGVRNLCPLDGLIYEKILDYSNEY